MFDSFPKDFQQRTVLTFLDTPQTVVSHFVPEMTPPKHKRIILLGHHKDTNKVGCLIINSKPSRNNHHYFLTPQNRNYIIKNCHVACDKLIEIDHHILLEALMSKNSKHLGEVSDSDFLQIKNAIINFNKIKPGLLKKYNLM